jgi:hypothetical protein
MQNLGENQKTDKGRRRWRRRRKWRLDEKSKRKARVTEGGGGFYD